MRATYRVYKDDDVIARVEAGKVQFSYGTLTFFDHLGPHTAYAPGAWTLVERVKDDE